MDTDVLPFFLKSPKSGENSFEYMSYQAFFQYLLVTLPVFFTIRDRFWAVLGMI